MLSERDYADFPPRNSASKKALAGSAAKALINLVEPSGIEPLTSSLRIRKHSATWRDIARADPT